MGRNLKIGLIIGGIILIILVILPLIIGLVIGWQYFGYETEEHHMMGPWMMGGFSFGWFMPIIGIVILGLLVWAVVTFVQGAGVTKNQDSQKLKSALDILKERYAKGEIDKGEYEDKKKDLA